MQDTDPTPASRHAQRIDPLSDWLRLESASGVGLRGAHALLERYGSPRAIFQADPAGLALQVGSRLARALQAAPSGATRARIDAVLAWSAQAGQRVLTLDDPDYPPMLAHTPGAPLLLYLRGRAELLARPALAIVGSRNATAQGKANASAFAAALSGAGICVVSGLALGIDAAAHEGALRGPGATLAVIGTGADLCYPARNRILAGRIAEEGCIVSEYALGTPPVPANFPRRNRIISGLSAGVLVVEAAAQSGSLITARVAGEQGREVFALPGSIHAPLARGCHKLIREGARLVETVDDILEAMRMSPLAAPLAPVPASHGAALPSEAQCTLVLDRLGHDPVDVDTLLAVSGLDIGQLSMALLALELAGMLERLPGGKVQRVHG